MCVYVEQNEKRTLINPMNNANSINEIGARINAKASYRSS